MICPDPTRTDTDEGDMPNHGEDRNEWSCSRVVDELVLEFRTLRGELASLERSGSLQAQTAIRKLETHELEAMRKFEAIDGRLNAIERRLESIQSAGRTALAVIAAVVSVIMTALALWHARRPWP